MLLVPLVPTCSKAANSASNNQLLTGLAFWLQILFNITGCCRPGEVLAFMGPSGSGKTTLLSIIGGRAQSMMRREGDVLFNGRPMEKRMKRSIGYVMQDDLLYEALTVFEVVSTTSARQHYLRVGYSLYMSYAAHSLEVHLGSAEHVHKDAC